MGYILTDPELKMLLVYLTYPASQIRAQSSTDYSPGAVACCQWPASCDRIIFYTLIQEKIKFELQ